MEQKHINSGFKIPKDYLSSFNDKLHTKINSSINETSGFKTPEHYFENFNINVNTIKAKKSSKLISLFNKKTIVTVTSIAATITLLITITFNNNSTLTIDNVANTTLENYILNEVSDNDYDVFLNDTSMNVTDFITLEDQDINTLIDDLDLNDIIEQ